MGHKSVEERETALLVAAHEVPVGSVWEHYDNGHFYRVAGHTILEALDVPAVRYHEVVARNVEFTRTLDDWNAKVEQNGAFVPRFQRVDKTASE